MTVTRSLYMPGVAVSKAVFANFSAKSVSDLKKVAVMFFETRSDLTAVAADERKRYANGN